MSDAVAGQATVPPISQEEAASTVGGGPAEASHNFSFVRYRADYVVNADATSSETDEYEIRIDTKSGVDQFSQVRLSYSEKMETLEVLEAYTLTTDGQRHDVPQDKIYTQESYSSASAAMYADRKVKVIVFPNLAPGHRLVYRIQRQQLTPYFPGYFGLWETFSVFFAFEDARVTLTAPSNLPIHLYTRGVRGSERSRVSAGKVRWEWRYSRPEPMPNQNWSAATWEYSPVIMASTFSDYSQVGRAYQAKAAEAARVTPKIQAQADAITAGMEGRREQADAIYQWVAQNIRYVAVYLGNGGLEPNPADSILDNRYGDCKDHTVILEAMLAAKGIASTPVLIGADSGPHLPNVALLERFNHAINYLPEFDLYLDSTSPYARFGQLPGSDLGTPVVHTADGRITRTPADDSRLNYVEAEVKFDFVRDGDVSGQTRLNNGPSGEVAQRSVFAGLNAQNRARIEESIMAVSGFNGNGRLALHGDPQDLEAPFSFSYQFQASDYVDFDVVGGMTLPDIPGADSMRRAYASTASERNLVPFYCNDDLREETYVLTFPDGVPIIAVPKDSQFENRAGAYSARWSRQGQTVTVTHRLHGHAVHGEEHMCRPEDYPAFRDLYQSVRRGFRGQILYGDLSHMQTSLRAGR
ncbi:MAG: DUF3857 domain-containing protein [Xanthomonadaceae bacterium]|nr:DUF3857 domain-containing protein [Xanthomonadaceae bacterium]